jgi:FkbM family methyltransferase
MPVKTTVLGFKHKVKRILEGLFRINICHPSRYRGCNVFKNIKSTGHPVTRVFDIGANDGQFAAGLSEEFPDAELYCFEPVSSTFRELEKNLKNTNIKCYNIGFGSKSGQSTIYITENASTNSLIEPEKYARRETVSITTLDQFVKQYEIGNIDLLKIDTEGFDLEVLKGAEATLDIKKVSFVYVEVGLNPQNKLHVPLEEISKWLFQKGFSLFAIYNQAEYQKGTLFADALFRRDEESE